VTDVRPTEAFSLSGRCSWLGFRENDVPAGLDHHRRDAMADFDWGLAGFARCG
jgi:hypothetical protein